MFCDYSCIPDIMFFVGWDILLPYGSEHHGKLAKIIRDSVRDRICVSTAVGQQTPRLLHEVIQLCYAVQREVSILTVNKIH